MISARRTARAQSNQRNSRTAIHGPPKFGGLFVTTGTVKWFNPNKGTGHLLRGVKKKQGERTDLTSRQPADKLDGFLATIEDKLDQRTAYRWIAISHCIENPAHRRQRARKDAGPRAQGRRLVVMAGGTAGTAAAIIVADRGYGMMNSVVGSLVVGLAIGADECDDLACLDATLELPRDHQFDNALSDIGF